MIAARRRCTFLVVFQGSFLAGFWTPLARPGWRHCYVIQTVYMPYAHAFAQRFSVVLNPQPGHVDLDLYWRTPEDMAQELYRLGVSAIVRVTVELPPQKAFALRGLITCVSVVKAVLGVRNWRILTPRQLYEHLLRHGGELVAEKHHGGQHNEPIRETGGAGAGSGDTARTGGATATAARARATRSA